MHTDGYKYFDTYDDTLTLIPEYGTHSSSILPRKCDGVSTRRQIEEALLSRGRGLDEISFCRYGHCCSRRLVKQDPPPSILLLLLSAAALSYCSDNLFNPRLPRKGCRPIRPSEKCSHRRSPSQFSLGTGKRHNGAFFGVAANRMAATCGIDEQFSNKGFIE